MSCPLPAAEGARAAAAALEVKAALVGVRVAQAAVLAEEREALEEELGAKAVERAVLVGRVAALVGQAVAVMVARAVRAAAQVRRESPAGDSQRSGSASQVLSAGELGVGRRGATAPKERQAIAVGVSPRNRVHRPSVREPRSGGTKRRSARAYRPCGTPKSFCFSPSFRRLTPLAIAYRPSGAGTTWAGETTAPRDTPKALRPAAQGLRSAAEGIWGHIPFHPAPKGNAVKDFET
jgi:hypothetical protein